MGSILSVYTGSIDILQGLSLRCLILCFSLFMLLAVSYGCNEETQKKASRRLPASMTELLSKEVQDSRTTHTDRYLSADYLENDYTLGPGDVLDIKVFGSEEFDRKLRVSGTGNITFPYIGSVLAEGRTLADLEFTLEVLLGAKYLKDPQISIFIEEFVSKRVTVVGEVQDPQVVSLRRNSSTIMEVLGRVGGVTVEAGNTIYVIRTAPVRAALGAGSSSGESAEASLASTAIYAHNITSDDENIMVQMQDTVIPIDMRDLFEYRNPMANIEMFPGDIISVPRGQLVFIMGQVEKPGAHKLTEGMTALQAISMGGKFAPTFTPRNVKLIRRASDGSTTFATLDLAKITKGEEDDVEVLPGDIFIVGRSISKTVALQVMKIANTAVGYMAGRVLYDRTAGDD